MHTHTDTLKLSTVAQIQSPLHLRNSTHTHCCPHHLQESFLFDVVCATIDPGGRPNVLLSSTRYSLQLPSPQPPYSIYELPCVIELCQGFSVAERQLYSYKCDGLYYIKRCNCSRGEGGFSFHWTLFCYLPAIAKFKM